jgi:hypothetical protein
VILRRIIDGTPSHQGSLALATFASFIEICGLQSVAPVRYLRQVLAPSRKGREVATRPPVPMAS